MKKILATLLIAVVAVSALSFLATAEARGFMSWRNFDRNQNHGYGYGTGNWPVSQSFVRVNAVVTDWGTTEVNGTMQAQSRTVVFDVDGLRQGVTATAVWTENSTRPLSGYRLKENSTYTFFTARLVEANVSLLDFQENDFYINGTWNVFNVTSTFKVITDFDGEVISFNRNTEAKALATKAYGEFNVTTGWTKFTLQIQDADVAILSGLVYRQRTTSTQCNAFKIIDDNVATFTKADLRELAKAYGATPGWGNYDQRMDYNFNYKIDVTDLTTAAANVNV